MCNWMGDTFWAMQVIPAIKEKYPDAEIWAGVKSHSKDLLYGLIDDNKMIVLKNVISDRHREKFSFKECFSELKKVRKENFDLAIDLTGNRYSALFLFLGKCRKTVGLNTNKFSFLYSVKGPEFDYSQHLSKRPWEAVNILFPVEPSSKMIVPSVTLTKEAEPEIAACLDKKTALLMPGAGWSEKLWPLNNFIECGKYLKKEGYEIIISGASGEKELCSALKKELPGSIIFIKPLKKLVALMPRIDLAITNDSGPAHLLAAFGIKIITIFCGNTEPAKCGPIGENAIAIKKSCADVDHVIQRIG